MHNTTISDQYTVLREFNYLSLSISIWFIVKLIAKHEHIYNLYQDVTSVFAGRSWLHVVYCTNYLSSTAICGFLYKELKYNLQYHYQSTSKKTVMLPSQQSLC